MSVVISTQVASDSDLLSVLIDDGLAGRDPETVVRLYAATPEMDPFSEDTVRLANPGYDFFMNQRQVMAMAAAAQRMPAREAEYKNLILNEPVEIASPFISPAIWKACGAEPRDLHRCTVFGGLDLSATNDLTCLVLAGIDPVDATWSVLPIFWLPAEGLMVRAQADRAPYDIWADQGFIELVPGASVSYGFVAERLRDLVEKYEISRIAFDCRGVPHLKPWLVKAGFSEPMIKERFIEFGQGFKSMSPALRDLESMVLDRNIRHRKNPVLSMCAANSAVASDAAGNRKLNEKRASVRIDGMVALAMALAAAPAAWTAKVDIEALIG